MLITCDFPGCRWRNSVDPKRVKQSTVAHMRSHDPSYRQQRGKEVSLYPPRDKVQGQRTFGLKDVDGGFR